MELFLQISICVCTVCENSYSHEINCAGCEGTLGPAWLIAVTWTKCVSPQVRELRVHELLVEEQFWPVELKAIYCCAPWAGSHDTTIPVAETLDTTISVIWVLAGPMEMHTVWMFYSFFISRQKKNEGELFLLRVIWQTLKSSPGIFSGLQAFPLIQ